MHDNIHEGFGDAMQKYQQENNGNVTVLIDQIQHDFKFNTNSLTCAAQVGPPGLLSSSWQPFPREETHLGNLCSTSCALVEVGNQLHMKKKLKIKKKLYKLNKAWNLSGTLHGRHIGL